MKKMTVFFDKDLQRLHAQNPETKKSPSLSTSFSVFNFFVQMGLTGILPEKNFNCLPTHEDDYLDPKAEILEVLEKTFVEVKWVEAFFKPGPKNKGIEIEIRCFRPGGREYSPALVVEGYVDDAGAKFLSFCSYSPLHNVGDTRTRTS